MQQIYAAYHSRSTHVKHMTCIRQTNPPPLGNCSAHATSSSFEVPPRAASYSRLRQEGRSCTHHSNSMAMWVLLLYYKASMPASGASLPSCSPRLSVLYGTAVEVHCRSCRAIVPGPCISPRGCTRSSSAVTLARISEASAKNAPMLIVQPYKRGQRKLARRGKHEQQ